MPIDHTFFLLHHIHSQKIYISYVTLMSTFINSTSLHLGVIQKVRSLRRGGTWGYRKANKNEQVEGGSILQFSLLIIMAVWNNKQTIMKDYNIQPCQWMACDHFRQPFLLCTTFCSFLCTVHYFLCAFSAKIATYSLVIDNVYFVISN